VNVGPSISMFVVRHPHVYWLFFFALSWGVWGVGIYRKRKGLAGKYYDVKLAGFWMILILVLVIVWKYTVYKTIH
jgi:hypothetical protein